MVINLEQLPAVFTDWSTVHSRDKAGASNEQGQAGGGKAGAAGLPSCVQLSWTKEKLPFPVG